MHRLIWLIVLALLVLWFLKGRGLIRATRGNSAASSMTNHDSARFVRVPRGSRFGKRRF